MLDECIVCLQSEGAESTTGSEAGIIKTSCCHKAIHQTCLDTWLNQYHSRGRCPHCRHRLQHVNEPSILLEDDPMFDDIEYRWRYPRGYIHITSGNGTCNIRLQEVEDVVTPIVHKCLYADMETTIPDEYITDGHVIVLTDEDGNYFDIINIPIGWMVSINNENTTLQLSHFLRLEN